MGIYKTAKFDHSSIYLFSDVVLTEQWPEQKKENKQ